MNIWNWLKGKKSYIVAIAVAVVTFCLSMGYITQDVAVTLYGLLGASGVATLRHGLSSK